MRLTRYPLTISVLVATLGLLPACGDDADPGAEPNVNRVQSDLARNASPDVTAAELDTLLAGNRAFALELHAALETDGNLLSSPLSIRMAFAMVYAGAKGQTAQEMSDALSYGFEGSGLDDDRLHNAFNALDVALASRNRPAGEGPDGEELEPVEIYVANAFWGQRGYPWLDTYLDTLAFNYGAGVYELDFDADPDGARQTINDWVEARTRDRILDLLPEGSIDPGVAAVLTNAIYLKAPWAEKFEEEATRDQAFTRLDGSTVDVPIMHQLARHGYTEGDGYQALEMTYRGDDLSMVVLLPAAGNFETFESQLDATQLAVILDGLESREVEVGLPRFTFESELRLKEVLVTMGMELPFSGAADLSGMIAGGGLFIDEAYHKTFIAVDEGGTEAAAATAVVVRETSAPVSDATFTADRPFLFAIRDIETGALLFFGRVVDPS